jgi:hypothetical protein
LQAFATICSESSSFFISLMDPFCIPISRIIHKFRTRKHYTQAVLPTKAAGETHCFKKVSCHSYILCVNSFLSSRTQLAYRVYLKFLSFRIEFPTPKQGKNFISMYVSKHLIFDTETKNVLTFSFVSVGTLKNPSVFGYISDKEALHQRNSDAC